EPAVRGAEHVQPFVPFRTRLRVGHQFHGSRHRTPPGDRRIQGWGLVEFAENQVPAANHPVDTGLVLPLVDDPQRERPRPQRSQRVVHHTIPTHHSDAGGTERRATQQVDNTHMQSHRGEVEAVQFPGSPPHHPPSTIRRTDAVAPTSCASECGLPVPCRVMFWLTTLPPPPNADTNAFTSELENMRPASPGIRYMPFGPANSSGLFFSPTW